MTSTAQLKTLLAGYVERGDAAGLARDLIAALALDDAAARSLLDEIAAIHRA
jgi:hypothetical protein